MKVFNYTIIILMMLILSQLSASAQRRIAIVNYMPYPIWIGVQGNPLPNIGDGYIAQGDSLIFFVPDNWASSRIWARTGCVFPGGCQTGDCGSGAANCNGAGGATPATLAEFSFDAGAGLDQDFYDVSLVDGYNLPMRIYPIGGTGGTCLTAGCQKDLNLTCPPELQLVKGGKVVGCKSACAAFGDNKYCCAGPNNTPATCPPTNYSQIFKDACTEAYSYAYDDATSTFVCKNNPDYQIVFGADSCTVPKDPAGVDQTICAGASATLLASGGGTYLWDNGTTTATNNVSPGATTTYSVTITNGCSHKSYVDQVKVTVLPAPIGHDGTYNPPGTANLSVTNQGGNYEWYTTPTGGAPIATGTNYTTPVLGVAGATYYVRDVNASIGSATVGLTNDAGGPVPNGNNNTGQNFLNFTANDNATLVSVKAKYYFNVASGIINATLTDITAGTSQTANPTVNNPGANGWQYVTVPLNFTLITGHKYTITVPGSNGNIGWARYGGWSVGYPMDYGKITVTGDQTTDTYSGIFDWKLNWTIPGADCRVAVKAIPNNNPPLADAGPAKSICTGKSTTIGGAPTGSAGTGTLVYAWSASTGAAPAATANPTVSPTATTTYTVTVTDQNGAGLTAVDNVIVTVNALPTANAGADQNICNGSSATITATGGTGYVWDNGLTAIASHVVSPIITTTYIVTVTDGNGCVATDQVKINVTNLPVTVASTSSATVCFGQTVNLSATGGAAYTWDNGGGAGSPVTVTPPVGLTNYTVTASTIAGGTTAACSSTSTVSVTAIAAPVPVVSATKTEFCKGGSTSLSATGGLNYSWDNALGTGSPVIASPTATTTYKVTVSDVNLCSAIGTIIITVDPLPIANAGIDQNICKASTATLNASGGTGFVWDNGLAAIASPTVTPASTTTYTVTVTDGKGCTGTDQVTINVTNIPTVVASASVPSVCLGGSISLSATGATNYTWDNGAGTGNPVSVIPVLGNTTYTVTASTVAGGLIAACSNTGTVTVTANPLPVAVFSSANLEICKGETTSVTVSGGLSYAWDNALGSGGPILVSPPNGITYNVTVTDVNGCTAMGSVAITVNPLPIANAGIDQNVCNGAATTLSATGGVSYVWDNGLTPIQTQVIFPTSTKTYTVTVKDGKGCTATDNVIINVTDKPIVTASSTPASVCVGGTVVLNATGSSLNYAWDNGLGNGNGLTTASLNVAGPITYTVTATTIAGGTIAACSNTASTNVTVNALPVPVVSATKSIICNGDNTQLSATNGVSFVWDNTLNPTSPVTASPSTTTTYNVTVKDINSCVGTGNVTITVNQIPTFALTLNNPTSCSGNDGSITLTGLTPLQAYTVNYKKAGNPLSLVATATGAGEILIPNLASNSYSDFIITANACPSLTKAGPFVLTDPNTPVFTLSSTNPLTCGGIEGEISINGLKALANYTVTGTYNSLPLPPTPVVTDGLGTIAVRFLAAGAYSNITIMDAASCSSASALTINLTDPTKPIISSAVIATPIITCGGSEGVVHLSGLTANKSYTVAYNYNGTPVVPVSLIADNLGLIVISGLVEGTYAGFSVIDDITQCSSAILATSLVLKDPNLPTFVTTNPKQIVTCSGNEGEVDLSGLIANEAYFVAYEKDGIGVAGVVNTSDGTGKISIGSLTKGVYGKFVLTDQTTSCVSLVDANTFILTDPTIPQFIASIAQSISSCGGSEGEIQLTGLVQNASFNIGYDKDGIGATQNPTMSNGAGTLIITPLTKGIYANFVVMNVQTKCTSLVSATPILLNDPALPIITGVDPNPITQCNGTGGFTIKGLIPTTAYQITFTSGVTPIGPANLSTNAGGDIIISSLLPGTYTSFVVDLNHCVVTNSSTLSLADPVSPTVSVGTVQNVSCGGKKGMNGIVKATVVCGNAYSLTWSGSGTKNGDQLEKLIAGDYNVTVTDNVTTCTAVNPAPATITVDPALTAIFEAKSPTCRESNGSLGVKVLTGSGNNSFVWNDKTTGDKLENIAPGSYYVNITDQTSSCTDSISIVLKNKGFIIPELKINPEIAKVTNADINYYDLSEVKDGSVIKTWNWDFGDLSAGSTLKNPEHTYDRSGIFTVTLTVSDSVCTVSTTGTIEVTDIYAIYIPNSFSPNDDGINDVFIPQGTNLNIISYEFRVLDRWGNQLFYTTDFYEGWNGRVNNEGDTRMNEDIYLYIINIRDVSGSSYSYSGHITLLK